MEKLSIARMFVFAGLLGLGARSMSSQTAPRSVLEEFCELDAQGKQLSADGGKDISGLFVSSRSEPLVEILVVKDFVVSQPNIQGAKAEFYVEYITLGKIDHTSLRFSSLPPIKVRSGFDLVLVKEGNTIPSTAGTRLDHSNWKIEGSPPAPYLSVEAALQFVSGQRNNSADTGVRRNADRTVTSLKLLRR
jgi:hypothetical protein